jgi:Xaa-Pro aminopeptidase
MPVPTPVAERLALLREHLGQHGLDAYVVPTADPHQGEYVPECWQRRAWLTGFTGSSGTAVVMRDRAFLWTDSRYWLQAEAELAGTAVELVRQGAPQVADPADWLAAHLEKGQVVGVDPRVLSIAQEKAWRKALDPRSIRFELVEPNLVDLAWTDRPARPRGALRFLGEELTGKSAPQALGRVRAEMASKRCDLLVVSALDQVAWLFNVRGTDVEYNPVAIAHAIVTPEEAVIFTDAANSDAIAEHLPPSVEVERYEDFGEVLTDFAEECERAWVEAETVSAWTARILREEEVELFEETSPVTTFKARKGTVELAGTRAAHVRDGVAMVRFLAWLAGEVGAGRAITEIDAADRLEALRAEGERFEGLSFPSISAFGSHGAIVHYRPGQEGDRVIDASSLYLIDSGAQYLDGTTDVTRTICLGEPTPEQRDRFTRVLRGHVGLARVVFPAGTSGKQLDTLARVPLWDLGLDYGHGTGHGVGVFLNVHEGPQRIGPKGSDVPLAPGMIVSNEPGYYESGHYGIRIENLIVVVERPELTAEGRSWLAFETITACPIDRGLIDVAALHPEERAWIDRYHAWVREGLDPHLDAATRDWLARQTAPL